MKSVSTTTSNIITNDFHNEVRTVVHGEWNLNRYYRTVVDNTPSEDTDGYDIELFPIESIVRAQRPTSGICKAVVGQATVAPDYHTTVPSKRFYTVDRDDEYKYWQSPNVAGATTPFAMTNCAPQVLYVEEEDVSGSPVPRLITANKILYTVENTFAEPVTYNVQVKNTTAGAWTTVASDIPVPNNGKVELWWNGTTWTTTKTLGFSRTVHAVRLQILNMDKSAYFNLIELGFRLELDLSADVEMWSDQLSLGEADFITPLGTISSNTGQVQFMNEHELYSNENPSSVLYGLLDRGAKITAWTKYGSELIQEFEMYSDSWVEEEGQTTVNLMDISKFFMDIKPRPVLWHNIPIQEVVWRLCDIVGFNNYEVTTIDTAPHSTIDIFWTDGQKTAWEIFSELSRSSQTAIYVDANGVLQVKTREAAFREDNPVYDFIKESVPGGKPSNIVSLSEIGEYEPNKIIVNYTPTNYSEQRDNIVPMEVVWEPEGAMTINASKLTRDLLIGEDIFYLGVKESEFWQYKGMVQIEGEFIRYEGKKYVYYVDTTRTEGWVTSFEEQKQFDAKSDPLWKHKNHYTGAFKITERGAFNSEEKDHTIDLDGWTKSRQRGSGTIQNGTGGVLHNKTNSTVTLSGGKNVADNLYTYLWRGNSVDVGYRHMGFRMKIDESGHKDKIAGFFFAGDEGLGSGYFLEIQASIKFNGNLRNKRNEIILYSMKANGDKKVFGGETEVVRRKGKGNNQGRVVKKYDKGARLLVTQNKWIDFSIHFSKGSGAADDNIEVRANGKKLFTANVSGSWRHENVSRFGIFSKGHSSATFEYVYGISNTAVEPLDSESWYDRIEGGYRGDQWLEDWTYEVRTVRKKIKRKWQQIQQKYNQRFFEEFGPIAHEVREMDVKFTSERPVLESRIYLSNTTQVVCPEFTGDNFGAKFILASISRTNAIVSGEDELTAGGAGTINHKVFIYGRPVLQKDAEKIEREDDWSIRRRGIIEVEYDSAWSQNKNAAERLANWLVTRWPRSNSMLETEVWGNPLIELGDIVSVDYNDISGDYYVVAINNSFEGGGLTTGLTLRRKA